MSLPIRLNGGPVFESRAGETLLDAALRAGITLEHSCRTGRCGSCRGRVAVGSTAFVHAELGLTPEEAAAGWILTCARSAESAIELEATDLGAVRLPTPRTLPCRIDALEPLSDDVLLVRLRLPPSQAFGFLPGQYIDVIGTGGLRRSYSLANSPRADGRLELHVRRVNGGAMSAYWFGQAKPNDLLRLDGPRGTFFLRDVAGRDLLLLATGTGMAPIKALLEDLAAGPAERRPRSLRVVWGGRRQADLYWNPAALEEAGLALQYTPVLSRADAAWLGARGYVQDALRADGVGSQESSSVYACGSAAMIADVRAELLAAGLSPRDFFSDAFVCSS